MAEAKCGLGDDGQIKAHLLLIVLGPTIFVDIGFDPAFPPKVGPPGVPKSGIQGVWALVDTGATESCIDDQLAVQLALPLVDRRPIAGVGGKMQANIYLAQIHVPSLPWTIYG